ncbi:CAP-Gly domain-containing linker protein 1-like isoform X1, partial [Clarias magur]
MPSCSVHHCVLFLLTLTLTTDPGAATEFPIYAKLHQSVTLPCETQCSGRGWWSLDNNRDVVFARCNQTSCTSVQQGYEMSHDQYKRGDLSLTITNPDYSMRETYTCECGFSDFATVRLRISTVSSVVQMSPGEDLKLDLSVPESVEVIYRGSDSADGVQICNVTDSNVTNNNVTQRSLQCNTEYKPRTSVSNSELTLRNMKRRQSGTYTIRNLDYKEDIRVYAVSVSGLTTGETAGIVILVLFLVLLIAGVMYYMWRKAEREKEETERKRREVKSGMEAVDDLIKQAILKPPVEMMAAFQQVEEKIKALEQKYRGDSEHSEHVTLFCNSKRSELVKRQMEEVDEDIKQTEEKLGYSIYSPPRDVTNMLQQVEQKINNLEQNSRGDRVHSGHVTLFCNKKREELQQCREMYETQLQGLRPLTGQVKSDMVKVYDLINETVHRAAVDEAELQRVEKKINGLEEEYSTGDREYSHSVRMFCYSKREYLRLYREVFKNTSLQSVIEK